MTSIKLLLSVLLFAGTFASCAYSPLGKEGFRSLSPELRRDLRRDYWDGAEADD